MRLYTVQPRFVYDTLLKDGTFLPQPRLDPASWLNDPQDTQWTRAYEWLCAQMEARGMARPSPDAYPVWAWRQWAGPARPCPDLRTSSMKSWSQSERHVLLTLEVPEHLVLVSDYDAWHWCLNYWFLARPREANAFERTCKKQGLNIYRQKPLPREELHQQVVESWENIFDLPLSLKMTGSKKSDQVLQANFWRLDLEHVVQAREFGQGLKSKILALPG